MPIDRPDDKVQLCVNIQCSRSTASKVIDLMNSIAKFTEATQVDDFYHAEYEEIECDVLRVDTDGTKLYKG